MQLILQISLDLSFREYKKKRFSNCMWASSEWNKKQAPPKSSSNVQSLAQVKNEAAVVQILHICMAAISWLTPFSRCSGFAHLSATCTPSWVCVCANKQMQRRKTKEEPTAAGIQANGDEPTKEARTSRRTRQPSASDVFQTSFLCVASCRCCSRRVGMQLRQAFVLVFSFISFLQVGKTQRGKFLDDFSRVKPQTQSDGHLDFEGF